MRNPPPIGAPFDPDTGEILQADLPDTQATNGDPDHQQATSYREPIPGRMSAPIPPHGKQWDYQEGCWFGDTPARLRRFISPIHAENTHTGREVEND